MVGKVRPFFNAFVRNVRSNLWQSSWLPLLIAVIFCVRSFFLTDVAQLERRSASDEAGNEIEPRTLHWPDAVRLRAKMRKRVDAIESARGMLYVQLRQSNWIFNGREPMADRWSYYDWNQYPMATYFHSFRQDFQSIRRSGDWNTGLHTAVFDYRRTTFTGSQYPGSTIQMQIPYWLMLVLLGAPPAYLARRRRRKKLREKMRMCPTCGYDLRASPVQCPECGTTLGQHESAMQSLEKTW
jgi:hypothetical protein